MIDNIEEIAVPPKYPRQDSDSYASVIDNIPMSTHFYYLDKDLYGQGGRCLKPFSQSGFVLNLLYTPFLNPKDLQLREIPYDQKNLGTVADTGIDAEEDVYVYKIFQGFNKPHKIGQIKKYDKPFTRPKEKSPLNESKLWQYPYYYISINDYINSPLILNTQYLKENDIQIMVKQPVSVTGGYTIYVPYYKGDKNDGSNEGLFSASGLDLPTSSSQYAQFMANSKASFQKDIDIAKRNAEATMLKSPFKMVSGAVAGAFTGATVGSAIPVIGNVTGAIGGAIAGGVAPYLTDMIDSLNTRRNAIESSQAQVEDMIRAPRNVNLPSSDILMALDRNDNKLWANKYTITDYYKQKLCDYWTLYGYKQNKLMYKQNNGLIKSRKYFNYIKTFDANIIGEHIDKTEIEMIKSIYNNGVTFWHEHELTKDHMKMYDYSQDNIEFKRP